MISETFYLLNLIAKLSPILLLYLWWVSPSVNKHKQTLHNQTLQTGQTWLRVLCGYVHLPQWVMCSRS